MAKHYSRLTIIERRIIEQHYRSGKSISWIARSLDRHKSTISREINRLGCDPSKYSHRKAQKEAELRKQRCRRGHKIQGALEQAVLWYLHELHCSPQQISGRLKRQYPSLKELHVSHETIYKYVYRSHPEQAITRCLRQKKKRRGKKPPERRGGIRNRVSIHSRPDITDREEFGHWEGDLIVGKGGQSAMGTLVERSSRYVIIVPLQAKTSQAVVDAFISVLNTLPSHLRRSLTYDQGSEMAEHQQITSRSGTKVYFADPGKPYQRGSNENSNGLIREYFPKGSDLQSFSEEEIGKVQATLNARPRPILGYATAEEIWQIALASSNLTLEQAKQAA